MAGRGHFLATLARRIRAALDRRADARAARRACRAAPPRAIVSQPEPRVVGSVPRARQFAAGNFRLAGHLVSHRGQPWEIVAPSPAFAEALHGFGWLDDLAAQGDAAARTLARDWIGGWVARFGTGEGPGWRPDLAGRRLMRLVTHAPFLLEGAGAEDSVRLFRMLGADLHYLGERAGHAPEGLPRFEALVGRLHGALALEGREAERDAALAALAAECARAVAADGGIATRNPEELLRILTLLVWATLALEEAGRPAEPALAEAVARMAPALRTLRMGDGGLARFHGGEAGPGELVDRTLAGARSRAPARTAPTMGFLRLAAGRTICVMDAGRPPEGPHGARAHASTLAIEVSSGRQPIVVQVGPGEGFGPDWLRAARGTAAHSTLMVERVPSSRFGPEGGVGRGGEERLVEAPRSVTAERVDDVNGGWILAAHDGYAARYGLVHERRLFLSTDGRDLRGEDTLTAGTEAQRRAFARMVAAAPKLGVAFAALFHLHPDVEAKLALAGSAVSLRLPSGESWVFRQSGGTLELADSVYLDPFHLHPRATRQIVVSGRAVEYRGQVTWAFHRAEEAPRARRAAAGVTDAPSPA